MVTTFGDLPAEIREAIYEHTLEDTPEVWVLSPREDERKWPPTPYVLTGFPAIMHICYESRAVALKRVTLAKLPLEDGAELLVPCRLFRPDFDYLYAAAPLEALTVKALPNTPGAIFKEVKHMAFPATTLLGNWKALYRHVRKFPALEDVSIVFGPHYGPSPGWGADEGDEDEDLAPLGFGGHCGRYRLARCPEAGLRFRIDSQTSAPAKKTIAGMRRDLDVLSRLVHAQDEERKWAAGIRTVRMTRLGRFFGDLDIQNYVQPRAEPSRS